MKYTSINHRPPLLSGGAVQLEDLCLTMQYASPAKLLGYEAVELCPGGADVEVSLDNVEEYVEATLSWALETGIRRQMEAFRAGFNQVGRGMG